MLDPFKVWLGLERHVSLTILKEHLLPLKWKRSLEDPCKNQSALFRPFSAFLALSCRRALFRWIQKTPGESRKRRKRALFLRYPWICLNAHLLNPHLRHSNFVARGKHRFGSISSCRGDTLTTKRFHWTKRWFPNGPDFGMRIGKFLFDEDEHAWER